MWISGKGPTPGPEERKLEEHKEGICIDSPSRHSIAQANGDFFRVTAREWAKVS